MKDESTEPLSTDEQQEILLDNLNRLSWRHSGAKAEIRSITPSSYFLGSGKGSAAVGGLDVNEFAKLLNSLGGTDVYVQISGISSRNGEDLSHLAHNKRDEYENKPDGILIKADEIIIKGRKTLETLAKSGLEFQGASLYGTQKKSMAERVGRVGESNDTGQTLGRG